MRIKLLTGLATASRTYDRGEVVDWPDRADAERLIAAGCAVPAEAPKGAK